MKRKEKRMTLSEIIKKIMGEKRYSIGKSGVTSSEYVSPVSLDNYIKQPIPSPSATPTPTLSPKKTPVKIGSKQRNAETDAFLENVALPITRQYGIPDPIVAGQFAAEGRLGGLGANRNNFFNLGAYDKNVSNAFRYKTPEEGVKGFAKLLTTDPRYASYFKPGRDPLEILNDYASTYASNPKYVQLITGTPEWKKYYK